MTMVLHFTDPAQGTSRRGAAVALDSSETCLVLFGPRNVRVREPLIVGWGRTLYRERNRIKVTGMGLMLHERFPERLLPPGFFDFNLSAFTNAVMHCQSCLEVKAMFQQIVHRPAGAWPPPPWWDIK